eukprot:SAG11_NODE_19192_length_472_cov_0.924933_1_plen_102_part_01
MSAQLRSLECRSTSHVGATLRRLACEFCTAALAAHALPLALETALDSSARQGQRVEGGCESNNRVFVAKRAAPAGNTVSEAGIARGESRRATGRQAAAAATV